jgi:hypothetical protein
MHTLRTMAVLWRALSSPAAGDALDGFRALKKAPCMLTRGTFGGGATERPILKGSNRSTRHHRDAGHVNLPMCG